jgi:hypothetical protein
MVVVGALTTALGDRTVVLDVDATVVVTEVVVGRVVGRVVMTGRGAAAGARVGGGASVVVVVGSVVVVVDVVVVVVDELVEVEVLDVDVDATVVVGVVVDGGPVVVGCANAGPAKTVASNNSAKVNPARTRVLVGDDRRLTGSSSD